MEKVIFDTNAYRYLVTDVAPGQIDKLLKKLKDRERQLGIESLMSPIVAKELLMHVANKKDPSYEKCLKAIKAMYLHNSYDGGKAYRLLASPEMLMAKSFFNETLPTKEETNKALIQIAYHLCKRPTDYVLKKFQKNLNLNRDHVLDSESTFAQTMYQYIKSTDPSATGWRPFVADPIKRQEALTKLRSTETSLDIAAAYLSIVYQLLRASGKAVSLTYEGLYDMAVEFIKVFPEVISLNKLVYENMINSEFNLLENSRANFLWDIQLMFNVGNHSIGNDKLYFVTADKAIISTAIKNNNQLSVLTYDEYRAYTG